MTLGELVRLADTGKVCALEVVSLPGSHYLVRAQLAERCFTLQDAHGRSVHLRSTGEVRELLGSWPVLRELPCTLVQHVAQDEACAVRGGPIEPLRMPFRLGASEAGRSA